MSGIVGNMRAMDISFFGDSKNLKGIPSLFSKDSQLKAYPVSDNSSLMMNASVSGLTSKLYNNNNGAGFDGSGGYYGSAPYDINVNLFATLEQGINLTTDNVNPRVILR